MNSEALARLVEVQQWLYREARLLDARRYDQWLGLMDDEVRYRVPSRSYVQQGNSQDFATWAVDRELDGAEALPLINDDLSGLRSRVARLQSGMAWAETPPSMTRRLVSNVEILDVDAEGRLAVVSTLFLAKNRNDERVLFTAQRRDRFVRRNGELRLLERYVILDDAVLTSGNLSVPF